MKQRIYNKLHRYVSLILALSIIWSCITNTGVTFTTSAVATPGIVNLTLTLKSGADPVGGRYLWQPEEPVAGYEIVYSIGYKFQGDERIAPEAIEITIPRHILKARNDVYADQCYLSVPEKSAAQAGYNEFGYTISGDKIIITNIRDMSSAAEGYIDIAYVTKRSTFEYRDGSCSDAPEITMTLSQNGTVIDTKDATGLPVYVNTDAQLVEVTKKEPASRSTSWNPTWGTKPDDADEYYYLVWMIVSDINATQPYYFRLDDVFSEPDSEIVGYKLHGSTKFTDIKEGYYDKLIENRYDYVLTKHRKSSFSTLEQYTQGNSVNVTVTPADGNDNSTQESSTATYRYDRPMFVIPTEGYNAWKYGNTTWGKYAGSNWDVADYGLTDFVIGTRENISGNVKYVIETITNAYGRTLMPGADWKDPANYGQVDMTYTLTDDRFYFNDDITTHMEEITIPDGTQPLSWEDYEVERIHYWYNFQDAVFDTETMSFRPVSVTYLNTDVLNFYARYKDDTDWRLVATDNLGTGEKWYDTEYVTSMENGKLEFKENCTSYKIITTNHHYKTIIYAMPYCKVKRSDRILSSINNNPSGTNMAWLTNLGDYKVTRTINGTEQTLFYKEINGRDYFIGYVINSSIKKNVTTFQNDIANKMATVGWKVDVSERYITNAGIQYVPQTTGTFYDLIPMGSEVNLSTVSIQTPSGTLDASQIEVSTIINYNNTGRTLLVVKVKEQFDKASLTYEIVQPWESIIDYGETLLNSVAYETGNSSIESGYPDNGGSITEYDLMKDLDPDVTTEEKCIYAERGYKVSVLIAASSGLTKSVKNATDYVYSGETTVRQNSQYVYKLRYNSLDKTKTSKMIFFDSLENYSTNEFSSDWRGRLQGIDTSQLRSLGIDPVVYYTSVADIDITAHHDLNELTSTDDKVWKKAEEFGNIENATGFAIDMTKDKNGNTFTLSGGESIVALVYMKAPASDTTGKDDPKTYNGIYFERKIEFINNDPFVIIPDDERLDHQAYTQVDFRIMADVRLLKVSSSDGITPIKGITFSLVGVSDYGTNVNRTMLTDIDGKINFSDVEKGTYTLTEVAGNDDYLPLEVPITVVIDNNGGITFDGQSVQGGVYFNIADEPRLHADIYFYKRDLVYPALFITDARFELSGTSQYGNNVMMYASSDANGVVTFPGIEYGTYTMRETNTDNSHILDGNVYTVNVTGNEMFSITVSKTEGQGDEVLLYSGMNGVYSVYNEPYHSFTLQKEAYGTGEAIPGVMFELKGETDSGTAVDILRTTNSRGQITYENLESGVYTIQEIAAPYGFGLDSTLRSVTIDKRGTITIDGISRNANNNYVFINKQNGAVTITKKWQDNENNASRDQKGITAKIYLSTDQPNVSSAKFGSSTATTNSVLNKVTPSSDIKAFRQYTGDDANVQDLIANDIAKQIDNGDASLERIYGWCFTKSDDEYYAAHPGEYELNTFYWWSSAKNVYMTDTSRLCRGLSECETIDLTGIDTSQVTNMDNLFNGDAVVTFLDLSTFDTSNVTSMTSMFNGCRKLVTVDLSSFDTSKVRSMNSMFANCNALSSLDLSGFDTSNVVTMAGMFNSCNSMTSLDLSSFDTSSVTEMNQMFYSCSKLTSLNMSNFDTSSVISMAQMFQGCSGFKTLDVSSLDTKSVTNMSSMFQNCTGLTSLDVSNFDTRNVTTMGSMFQGCNHLPSLDLSTFDTKNVNTMGSMFRGCSELVNLNLSGFDTRNVTSTSTMFRDCPKLETLDLSDFNTPNVTTTTYMFYNCKALRDLDISQFDTSNVTDMTSMFSNCTALTSLDVSRFDTSNVKNFSGVFSGCSALTSLDVSHFETSNATSMSSMFSNCQVLTSLDVSNFNTSSVTTMASMFNNCYALTSLDVSNFNTSNVTSMASMFSGCGKLTSLDVSHFDTSNVTNMDGVFRNCSALTSVNVSGFNTSKVTNMANMFNGCKNLTSLDVSRFDTSNVTTMANMFNGCNNLTSLDVSHFDTSNVTTMVNMFNGCINLTSLDVSRFNTANVTTTASMFYNCNKLSTIDVSNFNTEKDTNMSSMFFGCNIVTTLDVSGFTTDNVTTMLNMFSGCRLVTVLDVSGFNTAKVETMSGMFSSCNNVAVLDVSNFDTSFVTSMESMFYDCQQITALDFSSFKTNLLTNTKTMLQSCTNLAVIRVSDLWNMKGVTNSAFMFRDCYALRGSAGTPYTATYVDKTYARVDDPNNDLEGYLTFKFHDATGVGEANFKSNASASILTAILAKDKITAFKKYSGTNAQAQSIIDEGSAVRLDDGTTDKKIYGWNTNGTINWWSDADQVYFRQNANKIFSGLSKCTSIDLTGINTSKVTDMSSMFQGCLALTTLKFGNDFDTSNVTSMWQMFYNCIALTNLDLSGFNTEKVTNMGSMFKVDYNYTTSYTKLDLSSFNTANVTNMEGMFIYNKKLTTLIFGDNFNTSNVQNMSSMFYYCSAIKNLTLPDNFLTANVTNMSNMFCGCTALQSVNLGNFDTSKVTQMDSMFNQCYSLPSLDLTNFDTSNVTTMREMFKGNSKVALDLLRTIDISSFDTSNVTDMYGMFYDCRSLSSLKLGSNFNTSKVIDMGGMFYCCTALKSSDAAGDEGLDVSGFDTSNVVNMGAMFQGCGNLTQLDVSHFNTNKVTRMAYMFSGCAKVPELDVSGFNTANVQDMAGMFQSCKKITALDVSHFNTSKVTNMSYMFSDCTLLPELELGVFNTANVNTMTYMFNGCSTLTSLNLSSFNTANVTDMAYMFNGCSKLETLNISSFRTGKVRNMAYMFNGCVKLQAVDLSNFDTTSVTNMNYMFCNCKSPLLTTLDFSSFDTSSVLYMDSMFSGCTGLTTLDLSSFNTESVTTMKQMFYNCTSLTSLDVSSFKAPNATTMYQMFKNCSALPSVNVTDLDTSSVTNMQEMFFGCSSLTTLDVSKFNTSKVTNLQQTFYGCKSLPVLDVSHFDTSKVTTMLQTFYDCESVEVLDVSNFDTSKVTTMNQMFYNCYNLQSLDFSNFNTSKVNNMIGMFQNCRSLTTLDLSSFDTSLLTSLANMFTGCTQLNNIDLRSFNTFKVTSLSGTFMGCESLQNLDLKNIYTGKVNSMYQTFKGCRSLESLDLCNFETAKVTEMREMFMNCPELVTIYASDNWTTNGVSAYYSSNMFNGDVKLVGGNGTTYNSGKLNKEYAIPVEPGDTTKGYLTKKTATIINKTFLDSDTDPCNIVRVTDNIWTYTFTDLNPNLTYYAWEDAAVESMGDGYESSNLDYSPLKVVALQGTITNKVKVNAPPEQETGNLSVKKLLAAETGATLTDADLERSFVFTITLTDENDDLLSGTSLYGSIPFSNGVARVRMPGGVTTMLNYIPEGYHYVITEEATSVFQQSCENPSGQVTADPVTALPVARGVITKDTTAAVTYTNTKSAIEEKFGSVTIKKLVTGRFEVSGDYSFTIALTGLHPSEAYTLSDGSSYHSNAKGAATIDLTLTNNEEITLNNLPVGASYRITEAGGDYINSFEITDSMNLGRIVQPTGANTVKNTSLSTAAEYVDEDEKITVTFTNEKNIRQNVILKKQLKKATPGNADTFSFNVSLTGLEHNSPINTSFGLKYADEDGKLSFGFTMNAEEEMIFYNLPVGATYQFIESGNEWISSYYLTDANGGSQFVTVSAENTVAETDLATAVETVNEGEEVTVIYTNSKVQRDVTLSKMVDMTEGGLSYAEYSSQLFKFHVSLTGLEHNKSYTMQYTSKVYSGVLKTESFTSDDNGVAEVTVYLAHQQSVKFRSLPENAGYTITETPTIDYIARYTVTGNANAVIASESGQNQKTYTQLSTAAETVDRDELDVEVVFTNRYHYDPNARIYTIHIDKEIDNRVEAFGTPTFLFRMVNTDTGDQFTCAIHLSGNALTGSTTAKVTRGHYRVEEIIVNRYSAKSCQYLSGTTATDLKIDNDTVNIGEEKTGGKVFTFALEAANGVAGEAYLKYDNTLTKYNNLSHNDYALNHVA